MVKRRSNKKEEVSRLKPITAKTENQQNYIRSIIENDVTICIGPAGSGKSHIAAGIAAEHLFNSKIQQVIITRPLVCSGKDIGALPGELADKINPYLTPMQEKLKHFLGQAHYGYYINEKMIRFEPLEVMRGATFDNSYMILDEAQNCTSEQLKMFMTRIGENSKVLINGDKCQSDIRGKSGLEFCVDRLSGVEGVGIVKLEMSDIQRNGIIGRILTALEL
jgi:phosphate starvation-inducible protein PhoH and related proteins